MSAVKRELTNPHLRAVVYLQLPCDRKVGHGRDACYIRQMLEEFSSLNQE